METELRTHPICMVKGCNNLSAASLDVGGRIATPEGTEEHGPVEVNVCIKHARLIERGGNEDITLSTRGRS